MNKYHSILYNATAFHKKMYTTGISKLITHWMVLQWLPSPIDMNSSIRILHELRLMERDNIIKYSYNSTVL